MIKHITITFVSLVASMAYADLEPLDNLQLQSIQGQAGADISLLMSLNHTNAYQFDDGIGGACDKSAANNTGLGYCHFALSFNKRFVKNGLAVSDPTQANPANRLWLVFKGIQGTINLQKMGLDGVDLVYKTDGTNSFDKIKPAMQFSFDASLPILIRNLGFNALSIEQDNFTSYIDSTGKVVENVTGSTPAQDYGYLKATTYTSATAPNSNYDIGKETGFMGLKMNGNLALQGNIKMFSCDSSHPRC